VVDDTVGRIVSARVANPRAIAEAAAARGRRTELTGASGRLFLIAADHPARGSLRAGAVVRSAAVAAALGTTSAYTWLKLPILLLGGEATADDGAVAARWRIALKLPTVRGMVIGRALLYPPGGDVASVVDRTVGLL